MTKLERLEAEVEALKLIVATAFHWLPPEHRAALRARTTMLRSPYEEKSSMSEEHRKAIAEMVRRLLDEPR